MTAHHASAAALPDSILQLYAERQEAIHARLDEFRAVPASSYFYELVYCLLTPQSSARNAAAVVDELTALDFQHSTVDPEPFLRRKEHYIRFHHVKSGYLRSLKMQYGEVHTILLQQQSAVETRERLVRCVKGLGYKEATHFLRNIGRNGNLAILDRHILRNLQRYGIIPQMPATLSRTQYRSIEQQFQQFAERIGIPLNDLDLLFWSFETGEILK